jgi:hypothetical protein
MVQATVVVEHPGGTVEWFERRWRDLTDLGSAGWLAVAAWAAVALSVVALIYLHRQLRRAQARKAEQVRPQVAMFMEPHPADWHVIELVVRNFGRLAAHDVRFDFANAPTVARYEDRYDESLPEIVELQLPSELPLLAPGQEWRTVWDSARDRAEFGGSIRSRFDGVVTYYDQPRPEGKDKAGRWRRRREFRNRVVLDWATLQPAPRLELMTTHDLARQERQKLELLRSVLTYLHYASKETSPDILRAEIERVNGAAKDAQNRWRDKQYDETTVLDFPWLDRDGRSLPDRGIRNDEIRNDEIRNDDDLPDAAMVSAMRDPVGRHHRNGS